MNKSLPNSFNFCDWLFKKCQPGLRPRTISQIPSCFSNFVPSPECQDRLWSSGLPCPKINFRPSWLLHPRIQVCQKACHPSKGQRKEIKAQNESVHTVTMLGGKSTMRRMTPYLWDNLYVPSKIGSFWCLVNGHTLCVSNMVHGSTHILFFSSESMMDHEISTFSRFPGKEVCGAR